MKRVFSLLGALAFSSALFSQQINGTINDPQGKPLSGVTVSLLNTKDSSVVKLSVTQAGGRYSFTNSKAGNYLFSTSHVGYKPFFSSVFEFNGSSDTELPPVTLEKASAEMKGVTVSAKKPVIEMRADKTIFNVEASINSVGNDALELLRKSPGVMVDKDDNVSLSGKNGVQIYIDGKPSPLSGADLSNFLKSLQSAQIEAIEIITNPSAKYEAAGNAGIINIRLKKNKAFGSNGSVNAGWNIGTFAKYNTGANLNYRHKKINLFGSYNYNQGIYANYMNLYRTIGDTSFRQRSDMQSDSKSHGFKAGADYYANSRSTFGVMVNGNLGDFIFSNYSRTAIGYLPANTLDRNLVADNVNKNSRENINANFNYRFADTSGHELNFDADYGTHTIRGDQYQPNFTTKAAPPYTATEEIYNMLAPANIDIYSAKTDYEQNFKKGRLGFGGKVSYVQADNNFERTQGKNAFIDYDNSFQYEENINALYVNYNRQFKGFMVQAGLRGENTVSRGISKGFRWDYKSNRQISIDSSINRKYTNLFPSAAFTFNKNPRNQWSFSYSRRIDRPAYQDLNPFEFNLDKYTFQRGNTELRPQYTNSISVTNTYHFWLNTTLSYSHVSDVFAQIVDTTETSKSFITKKNLADQDIVSLNISIPFQRNWYGLFANINTYYSHYMADFGQNRKVDLGVYALSLYAQQTFKLSKKTTAEVSGFYSSPSIWQGTFKTRKMWGIDAGLQQAIFKGKGTVKASVTDIFHTMRWSAESNFSGQSVNTSGGWESRQFRLNFSYRFGNNQVKAARQRNTSLEDEKKRAEGGGGGIGQ